MEDYGVSPGISHMEGYDINNQNDLNNLDTAIKNAIQSTQNIKSVYSVTLGKMPIYWEVAEKITAENNIAAYIMTAGKVWVPSGYDTQNYSTTISDSMQRTNYTDLSVMQYALWMDADFYIPPKTPHPDEDAAGTPLYEEAKAYQNFYNNYVATNSYNPTIKLATNNPTIVVNKDKGTYTVGPYVANYPDDARFSYIEDMYVKDQNGNRINVTIIKDASNSNRNYPDSGKTFYVEFSYGTNPQKITLCANFAYIGEISIVYEVFTEGEGNLIQIAGDLKLSVDYTVEPYSYEEDEYGEYSYYDLPAYEQGIYKGYEDSYFSRTYKITYTANVYRDVYVKNLEENYDVQIAVRVEENENGNRTWHTKEVQCSVDVTFNYMKVAGRVFVDNISGKESKVDGAYTAGTDKGMSAIPVYLYSKSSGTVIASTTTDANGNYAFRNLNPLDTYYVRFEYNGQYYEPTYYTAPSNSGNYQNTSNGTDYSTERTALNNRFASIGSSPANYANSSGWNQTFTKAQLMGYTLNSNGNYVKTGTAVIDSYLDCTTNHTHTYECYETFGNLIIQSSSDATVQKMIQYVKDCKMISWTKNASNVMDYYPTSNVFTITQYKDKYGNVTDVNVINSNGQPDKSQHINQGYKLRQNADVRLIEDIDSATIKINGKSQTYKYNAREKYENDTNNAWEIGVRIADGYYNTVYSREIYPSDYQYKVSNYGNEFDAVYGKSKDAELQVYVTYRLYVRNQSDYVRTKIDEVVHYYDSDYEYVGYVSDDLKSYIQINNGTNKGTYDIRTSNTSKYASRPGTTTTISGYQRLYIQGLDGIYLEPGQSANIYLTFVVEKTTANNEEWIKLDEKVETAEAIGVGKESISEINGYSTRYVVGTEIPNIGKATENTVAGLVDVDSNPGNLNPNDVPKDGTIKYQNFEDDTDKAPNLRLVLYRGDENSRIISGYAWEDVRNQTIAAQATTTGNGIRENGEKLINGVTVELVEVMDNGTEYVWRTYENGTGTASKTSPIINVANIAKDYEFTGDTRGTYAFKSFVAGNYIVRFKYGDTVKTVLVNDSSAPVNSVLGYTGLNDTSYNGQDYKTTIYQAGLVGVYNGKNTSKQYNYDTAQADTALVSDAKDLYNIREQVINYSTGVVNNGFAEELSSYKNLPVYNGVGYSKAKMESLLNSFIQNTKMTAETGIISMEIEYNRLETSGNTNNNATVYHLANLDLGLEQRPKAQIEMNKDIKNLKVTLADGTVLFDATTSVDNLLWQSNPFYGSYKDGLMDPAKFTTIEAIRNQRQFGLVQPTIDQELMHGATIKITYEITAKNIGEVDYKEETFYYTGKVQNKNTVVTTVPHQIVDYVPNNMQYYEVDNKDYWKVTNVDDLITSGLINQQLRAKLEEVNTIITTTKIASPLVPEVYTQKVDSSKASSTSVPLVLTQLITSENKTDDLTYTNKVELVTVSNSSGRKMEFSIVGNQDPTDDPQELDTDESTLTILPPFGAVLRYIVIALITLVGAIIIACSIVFIKKKVLTK